MRTESGVINTARREGNHYFVPSSDGQRTYRVTPISCTCPSFEFRGQPCKHMQAVELLCPPHKPKHFDDPFEGF